MGRLSSLRLAVAVVVVVGLAATSFAARYAAMSAGESLKLVTLAAGVTLGGAVLAAIALRLLRGSPIVLQVLAVTSTMLATVALGAWSGARAMFLSQHDLRILGVVLCAAATVGLVTTLVLGDRIGAAATSLVEAARRIGDGEVLSVAASAAHATDTARLGRELELTARRLAEARRREQAIDTSRRELVAWISHDLRTPLAGLRALAEALDDGVVDGETARRYCSLMRVETERLSSLVDDLFELSRTQAGVLRLELQRVSLGDLVSDAVAGLSPVARAKGVHLEGRLLGLPADCNASPAELLRALRNVLENAVRHTPSDGTVVVEASTVGDAAVLSVADDGGGIPIADLPRVFDAGFQADPARTTARGAGLGLAIAKSIIEAHRGEIEVANVNGGARFTIRLPLHS
jgi:signal transduction histidine kinase